MYVITFYSFKGGVGRTLALVNVAAELALQGKSVLMVDFDLEAPGLDSFSSFNADPRTPGIVDFVVDYVRTGVAPLASDYIANCHVPGVQGGKLALMRSGLPDRGYSARLSGIDWQNLYKNHDGYLLFEDLKAQWAAQLNPDYVLIDSRTGHTDVGGICTRQLADSVVACFIPNEENIRGLETVVSDIRNESSKAKGRSILLHFVVSNVPYLDDENGILAKRVKQAKERLNFEKQAATIHRYESLSLLDNEVFVLRRARTRLARQYRRLAEEITSRNFADRDVALRLLNNPSGLPRLLRSEGDSLSKILETLQLLHTNDGEILHSIAQISKRLGREDEARLLLDRATSLGFRSPETMLDSARDLLKDDNRDGALINIGEALSHPLADEFTVSRAVELCLQLDPSSLQTISNSPAFEKLTVPKKVSVCDQMLAGANYLPVVENILRLVVERSDDAPTRETIRVSMMLCLIGQGKFDKALGGQRPNPSTVDIVDAFNYAMAEWGLTHIPPLDLFNRVLELGPDYERSETAKNILQCLSIAAWAVGDRDMALGLWHRATVVADSDSTDSFSAWRYLRVSPALFRDDLKELERMLYNEPVVPRVFREHWG